MWFIAPILMAVGWFTSPQSSKTTIIGTIKDFANSFFGPILPAGYTVKKKVNASALLNLIGQIEGQGNYNIIYGGKTANLTTMPVRDVIAFQSEMLRNGSPSTAVGKYQFIQSTLKELVAMKGLSGSELFTPYLQDEFAMILLERRGLQKYLSGQISEYSFLKNLSMEWASIPKDASGASYYASDGLNKALVSPSTVIAAIKSVKAVA